MHTFLRPHPCARSPASGALRQEAELVDADFECDGAGRSRGWVSIPAAEPSDQPCCPSEAAPRMRVLLLRCPAGILRVQRIESAEFLGGKGNRGRARRCARLAPGAAAR